MIEKVATTWSKYRGWMIPFSGFFFLSLILFWQTLSVGFLSDDFHALFIAREHWDIWKFFLTNIEGTNIGSTYGPFWNILMWGEYHLFGLHPVPYHVVSLSLYAGAATFVYMFVREITHKQKAGLLAAIIFLFLPGHVEAVSWIAVQVHLLASLFFLSSIYFYYRYVKERRKRLYVWSLLLVFCSLLTKEIAVTFIAIFPIIEIAIGGWGTHGLKRRVIHVAKHMMLPVLIFFGYFFVRGIATGVVAGYYAGGSLKRSFLELLRMLTELELSYVLSFPERVQLRDALMEYPTLLIIAAIVILCALYFFTRYKKEFVLLVTSYILISLPFLTLGFSAVSDEGERYGYMMSMVFCVFLGVLFASVKKTVVRQTGIAIVCVFLIVCAGEIFRKTAHWVQASELTTNLVQELIQMNFGEQDFVYIVGIPDSFEGAQMLRNGVKEAVLLYDRQDVFEGERIYMLTREKEDTHTFVELEETEHGIKLTSSDRSFTGFPVVEHNGYTFTLIDFNKGDHSGAGVEITGTSTMETGNIWLMYYTSGTFKTTLIREASL